MAKITSIAGVTARVAIYVGIYFLAAILFDRPAFPRIERLVSAAILEVPRDLAQDLPVTLARWFAMFSLGSLLGTLAGIAVGYIRALHRAVRFEIDFFRSLPATVLVVFIMAAFGDSAFSRGFPALYITFFTVLFYVAKYMAEIETRRVRHLKDLGASTSFILRNCLWFEVLPGIAIAIRQAISLSFLVAISVELIIGPYKNVGLGRVLYDWQFYTQYDRIWCGIAIIGLLGYLLNILGRRLHVALVYWKQEEQL